MITFGALHLICLQPTRVRLFTGEVQGALRYFMFDLNLAWNTRHGHRHPFNYLWDHLVSVWKLQKHRSIVTQPFFAGDLVWKRRKMEKGAGKSTDSPRNFGVMCDMSSSQGGTGMRMQGRKPICPSVTLCWKAQHNYREMTHMQTEKRAERMREREREGEMFCSFFFFLRLGLPVARICAKIFWGFKSSLISPSMSLWSFRSRGEKSHKPLRTQYSLTHRSISSSHLSVKSNNVIFFFFLSFAIVATRRQIQCDPSTVKV